MHSAVFPGGLLVSKRSKAWSSSTGFGREGNIANRTEVSRPELIQPTAHIGRRGIDRSTPRVCTICRGGCVDGCPCQSRRPFCAKLPKHITGRRPQSPQQSAQCQAVDIVPGAIGILARFLGGPFWWFYGLSVACQAAPASAPHPEEAFWRSCGCDPQDNVSGPPKKTRGIWRTTSADFALTVDSERE